MGWLSDLWSKIISWIAGFVRGAISQITKWIEDARVAINLLKYKIRMKIAGWLQDDTATILMIFGIVAAAIVGFLVGRAPWFLKMVANFKLARVEFKNKLGSIAQIMGFQVAYAVHRLSMVFFPEYQKMISDLHASVSAFMEVIGEPMRTASILLESGRALVYASYTLVGMEDNFKEASWLSGVQTWLNQAGQRIERYTRNPELIMHDIWMDVVQPNLAPANEAMGTVYSTLHNLSDKAITFTDNLDDFRKRLDDFTAAMPDEIRTLVESRLSPVTDKLDWILDEKLIPLTDKVGEGFAVVDKMILENETKILKLAQKTDDPLYLLELIDKLSGDRKEYALTLLLLLTKEKEYQGKVEYNNIVAGKYNAHMIEVDKKYEEPIKLTIPIVERPDLSVLIGQIKYTKDSWFVGEY